MSPEKYKNYLVAIQAKEWYRPALFSGRTLRIENFGGVFCSKQPVILNYRTMCLRPTEVPRNIKGFAIWVLDFWVYDPRKKILLLLETTFVIISLQFKIRALYTLVLRKSLHLGLSFGN